MIRLLTTFVVAGLSFSCMSEGEPQVEAPLSGGERLSYGVDLGHAASAGTITFERRGRGFRVFSSSPGYPEQFMRLDLQDRGGVKAFHLGHIWLPPADRAVGSQLDIGEVEVHELHHGRVMAVIVRPLVTRYYDVETGFLMAAIGVRGGTKTQLAQLKSTTVPGLVPVIVGRRGPKVEGR